MSIVILFIPLELFLFLHLKGSSAESNITLLKPIFIWKLSFKWITFTATPADLCAGKRCPNGFACTILINTNGDRWGSCQPNS